MKSQNRKLLVLYDEEPHDSSPSSPTFITYPIPEPPAPGAGISAAASPPRRLNPPVDSSLTLTFTVLLAALFFFSFFSVYLRRFSDDVNDSSLRHSRRRGSDSSRPSDELGSRKGIESSAVRSVPVVGYCADATYQIDCAICLAEFEEGETVKLIPGCRHVFHLECIDTWLLSHVTCPVCRGTQLFASSSESSSMSRSTVQRGDTCMGSRVVITPDLRRIRSCSSEREQGLIHRTLSY